MSPGIGAKASSKWSAMVRVDQPRSSTRRARSRQPVAIGRPAALDPEPEGVHGRTLGCRGMGDLSGYEKDTFTFDGKTRDVYRKGTGPAVLVFAEMPGITPKVLDFADRVVAIGCTAVVPHLFGVPGAEPSIGKVDQGDRSGVRVEGVLGVGHRQDQPGHRVVQGARPPGARAPRRPRRRGGRHVLHRELRTGHAPGARRAGAGAVAAVAPPRVHQEGPARPLHQRGRPREGARTGWPPSPTCASSASGSPATAWCPRTGSTTCARRWATGSSAVEIDSSKDNPHGHPSRSPTRCSPSTCIDEPGQPDA